MQLSVRCARSSEIFCIASDKSSSTVPKVRSCWRPVTAFVFLLSYPSLSNWEMKELVRRHSRSRGVRWGSPDCGLMYVMAVRERARAAAYTHLLIKEIELDPLEPLTYDNADPGVFSQSFNWLCVRCAIW